VRHAPISKYTLYKMVKVKILSKKKILEKLRLDFKRIEVAIFIDNGSSILKLLSDPGYFLNKYDKIYFGEEFCERQIPSFKSLKMFMGRIIDKIGAAMFIDRFVYVTPYVTDDGLSRLQKNFDVISTFLLNNSSFNKFEIVVNDVGVLNLIKNNNYIFKITLGRILSKQRRSPDIIKVFNKMTKFDISYFKDNAYGNYQNIVKFKQYGVSRIEFDNLIGGVKLNEFTGVENSIYYPYCYVTTARKCRYINCENIKMYGKMGIFPCNKECERYLVKMKNEIIQTDLIMRGNTSFFLYDEGNYNFLDQKKISRVVYTPYIIETKKNLSIETLDI
jgi:hypothetical protein